jgi:hypothetical protein
MIKLNSECEKWIKAAKDHFDHNWGLSPEFALMAARLYLVLFLYGLHPQITSGYRSPEHQKELMDRYKAGDPSIKYKPAENSKHSNTDFLGLPAAMAIDISTNNHEAAAQVARMLGIKPGFDFGDPVHFYI